MAVVEAHNLSKHFGDIIALDAVSLEVHEGEVVALLGPNGAGKTTTVRCLAGILTPNSGEASVAGLDVVTYARQVRRLVGLLTEFPGLYGRMKPLEYLAFFGAMHGLDEDDRCMRAETLLRQFELWEARDRRLGQFSKGMRQKMALVRALLHDPQVLFLDEPTSALDPEGAFQVRDAIASLRRAGHTILLCTHNLAEAEALADRIIIMGEGRILATGTVAELKRNVLGKPVYTLHVAHPVEGLVEAVNDIASVLAYGSTWIRYGTDAPIRINPQIVERVSARGGKITHLSEAPQRLEEVYLRLMRNAA